MTNPFSAQLQNYFINENIPFAYKQVEGDDYFYLTHELTNGPEVTLSIMFFSNRAVRFFLYDFIHIRNHDKLLPVLTALNSRRELGIDFNCYIDNDCDIIIQYDYSVGEAYFSPAFFYGLCKKTFEAAEKLYPTVMKILLNTLH